MTIRIRLTLFFTVILSVLLGIFCLVIYYETSYYRDQEFQERLRNDALSTSAFVLNEESLNPKILQIITEKKITLLTDEHLLIFEKNGTLKYDSEGDKPNVIPKEKLMSIKEFKEFFWKEKDRDYYGTTLQDNYFVILSAIDVYGQRKQHNLLIMLASGWLVISLLNLILGNFLAGWFLSPLKKIIENIDQITGKQLNLRLPEGNQKDELEQLSMRFNRMLNRLETAFNSQKAFVSHASHELRTPLTSITGQLQVSLMVDKNEKDLRNTMQSALDDLQQLNKLTNNLLDLTSISGIHERLHFQLVNVELLLWQAHAELCHKNKEFSIEINFAETSENLPEIYAHETLLYLALLNLMENAAKFGENHHAKVNLNVLEKGISVDFKNQGNPISENDKKHIFEPFKRGLNAQNIKGHGVGLSLVKQIIELHKGSIQVESNKKKGTTFSILLPFNF